MIKKRIWTIAVAGFALASCQDATAPTVDTSAPEPVLSVQGQQAERVVPGRILARFADGADPAEVARRNGIGFERSIAGGRLGVLNGAIGNERALAARLGADADVVFAEPDFLRTTTAIDPRLWAFENPGGLSVDYTRGRNRGSPVANYLSADDADMDNMERLAVGGRAVAIASIDTGVDMDHPEFGGATIVAGWDFYSNDADPSDEDDHGTHTTGTMVGDAVGVAGVAGAASNVTVHVYRVCGAIGCPTSAIVDAIGAAADAGVVAMNLSLGGGSLSQSEADAIAYATGKGSLVIASAGNGGTGTVSCPACDPNAISVAATNWLDEQAYYTNWGSGLDLSAPGGELYSNTTSESGIYSAVRNGYAYFQGTSMAAPQVTGTAAIVASITGLEGAALRSRLESTVDDIGSSGYDTSFGHGRVNAYRAVTGNDLDGDDPPPPPTGDPLAASFSYSCSGYACSFDASGSTGSIDSWGWNFGNGQTASGVSANHTFPGDGNYAVVLTVESGSASASTSSVVRCKKRGPNVRCN